MIAGKFRYLSLVFTVFDDGSLACGRTWYQDPPTAARELSLDPGIIASLTVRVLEDWARVGRGR